MGKILAGCLAVIGAFVLLLIFIVAVAHRGESGSASSSSQVTFPIQSSSSSDDHTLYIVSSPFSGKSVSDGRTYSVSIINQQKNDIPTGTELFVQGSMCTVKWGPTDDCTWLLAAGERKLQHGLATLLVCNMTPTELQALTHSYHYGDEVQVHGEYAPSLDFDIFREMSIMGRHFGVPVLDNCTFASPTGDVMRPLLEQPRTSETGDGRTTPQQQSGELAPEAINQLAPTPTEQVSLGDTPEQVISILGAPVSVTTGEKHIYTYAHMSVVFVDGKVSEVHQF